MRSRARWQVQARRAKAQSARSTESRRGAGLGLIGLIGYRLSAILRDRPLPLAPRPFHHLPRLHQMPPGQQRTCKLETHGRGDRDGHHRFVLSSSFFPGVGVVQELFHVRVTVTVGVFRSVRGHLCFTQTAVRRHRLPRLRRLPDGVADRNSLFTTSMTVAIPGALPQEPMSLQSSRAMPKSASNSTGRGRGRPPGKCLLPHGKVRLCSIPRNRNPIFPHP